MINSLDCISSEFGSSTGYVCSGTSSVPVLNGAIGNVVFGLSIIIFLLGLIFWGFIFNFIFPKT